MSTDMNMQTVGTAMPVMLVQTNIPQGDGKTRADFPSDRAFVKYLLKKEKLATAKGGEKKDEKKGRTFNYFEVLAILMMLSFPIAIFEIGLGYGFVLFVRKLAGLP